MAESLTLRGTARLLLDLLAPSAIGCMCCDNEAAVQIAGLSLCLVCRDERLV